MPRVAKVWQSAEAQDALKKIGETAAPPMTSSQSQGFVQSESRMWATVVKDANIKVD